MHPHEPIYTYWAYLRDSWARNAGLRLDHLLVSPSLIHGLVDAGVDRSVRGEDGASDHAPAWIELKSVSNPDPHPVTPDGLYFVVRGRLWRCSDPSLNSDAREQLVKQLMQARRAVGVAKRSGDNDAEAAAHEAIDKAKHALGERGAVWWTDGAPDFNRHLAKNTPYAEWFAGLAVGSR